MLPESCRKGPQLAHSYVHTRKPTWSLPFLLLCPPGSGSKPVPPGRTGSPLWPRSHPFLHARNSCSFLGFSPVLPCDLSGISVLNFYLTCELGERGQELTSITCFLDARPFARHLLYIVYLAHRKCSISIRWLNGWMTSLQPGNNSLRQMLFVFPF